MEKVRRSKRRVEIRGEKKKRGQVRKWGIVESILYVENVDDSPVWEEGWWVNKNVLR